MPEQPIDEEQNLLEQLINFIFGRGGGDQPAADSLNPLDAASAGVGQPGAGIQQPQQQPVQPIIINLPAEKGTGSGDKSGRADSTLDALAQARNRIGSRGASSGSTRFTGTRANQARQSGKESGRRNPELRDKAKIKKRRASRARKS